MRIYKPIDGLLPEHRRQQRRLLWLAIPAVLLAGLIIYFLIVGSQVAEERRAEEEARLLPSRVIGRASGLVDAARRYAQDPARHTRPEPPPPEPEPAPVAQAAQKELPRELALAQEPAEPAQQAPEPDPEDQEEAEQGVASAQEGPAPQPEAQEVAQGEEQAPGEVTAPQAPKGVLPDGFEGSIKSGQTIYDALVAHQLSPRQIQPAINALGKKVDFRRTRMGDYYRAKIDPEGKVVELSYKSNPEVTYVARHQAGGKWQVQERKTPLEVRHESLGGTVRGSVYMALRDLNASPALISRFIDMFSYDINFASESKPGDTFRLVFEKVFADGRYLRTGDIVAAEYKTSDQTLRIYYDKKTETYYNAKGQSLKRMFLLNPVPQARLTSRFGKRKHPILKRWMMHNGVDYAAATGTPVKAIAAGKVTFVGRKGANGNLVALRHSNGMTSFYAHLHGFARGLKTGQEVRQGQVIGYVGSTGRSTGPHLHLGVKSSGGFIDPLSIKSTRSAGLSGYPLKRFKGAVQDYDKLLAKVEIKPPSTGPDEPVLTGGDDLGVDK